MAVLVNTSPGSRMFHDARGARVNVAAGETFTVDRGTAAILLETDDSFAYAETAPPAEPAAPAASGPISVADLTPGGTLGKPEAKPASEPAATASSEPSPVDAAAAASSDGDDQGGSEPADDPDAAATGEAGTPPSSEASDAGVSGAVVLS